MKFITIKTENRSKLHPADGAEGLDLLKRTREARPVRKLHSYRFENQMFHLSSLFNAVELLVHLELLGRAEGFALLIGKVENQPKNSPVHIHTWLKRNSIIYHVDDPLLLPFVAEDQHDFDRTPGICQPLQTVDHSLLQVNRPLMRAATMAVKACRPGGHPLVRFDTMEVTQEFLKTAIKVRALSLDQHQYPAIETQHRDIDLHTLAPFRWVV